MNLAVVAVVAVVETHALTKATQLLLFNLQTTVKQLATVEAHLEMLISTAYQTTRARQ